MKQVAYLVMLAGLCLGQVACDNRKQGEASQQATTGKMPKMEFADQGVYDFGTITEGDTVEHNFAFTNTGEFPLIINNITASCGCTTPEWPREPIAPGQKSSIRVRFDSKGKVGAQNKTVTVFANTEPAMSDLQFRVMVNAKAGADSTKS
ncbi:DUF1573 domain-containing protein [Rudanella paleaurantiibacter]|uniref:DUF1573 domain-containing protein n=1 Tax=Rudanella paleaurantiibacter TaxID=2614655 RepID=A0A7J5TZQ8_9BACT|nr:DUF1573 domain-containing protein [Rudanella paleaurantiibacter]KAB7730973.1 DUF1573 domain-containing protein [Rudanella paleaurantiibacter]